MSPRSKKQFETIREEKRTLIMNAALEHFARDGYHNTTITHLAKHAGISKGLMYNYFTGKEELLSEIINRSLAEISEYFDPDKDGILNEDEFELFVRRYLVVIRQKVDFWRLFFQLMLQKDVRDQLLMSYSGTPAEGSFSGVNRYTVFKTDMAKIILDYFMRKKLRKPADYDPVTDMNMFIYTLSGLALMTIYSDLTDEAQFEKTINSLIGLYK
ncbi:MAG TPA: TetR/AcrR family transcriptional regulator [Bacteroidales bacterium]|jgi:AcrR family transcriptional regulator|nr:TetR/AcrR family transcriptional regulator [Bacteroidales bacterium]